MRVTSLCDTECYLSLKGLSLWVGRGSGANNSRQEHVDVILLNGIGPWSAIAMVRANPLLHSLTELSGGFSGPCSLPFKAGDGLAAREDWTDGQECIYIYISLLYCFDL